MIQLKDLTKIYKTEEIETTALNGISLQIKKGEFISIMGASGCGKSTLLNVLGMLDSSTSGSYNFLNQEVSDLKEKDKASIRKKNIGFVFQNFNLIDELTVYDNIELPLLYNNIKSAERRARVEAILDKMGIAHRAKHFPQQLSGGQQQRVAVARALVTEPELILADEPTGNLDSKNGNEVMELLTDLHMNGSTIIMVTHSTYDASFSQKTITLRDGQIISEHENKKNVDVFES